MLNSISDSLGENSTFFFGLAAAFLVVTALGAALNTFTDRTIGLIIKEIFQAAGYGTAFIGGLSLAASLMDDSKWLSRAAGVLAALGAIGAAVLFLGYTLQPLGVIGQVPTWVVAFGIGVPLGQIGLLLFGVSALRSDNYSVSAGLALMGPLLAFVLFFLGAGVLGQESAPFWAPFATVLLQTIAHLLLALVFTGEVTRLSEPAAQPAA